MTVPTHTPYFRNSQQPAFALVCPTDPHPRLPHDFVPLAMGTLTGEDGDLTEIDHSVRRKDYLAGRVGRNGCWLQRWVEIVDDGDEVCDERAGGQDVAILEISTRM
jgi:hypothetical protein